MGQEITHSRFRKRDFSRFTEALAQETALLGRWLSERRLSTCSGVAGFELEAWLVDRAWQPAPINEKYLARLDDALYSPELSRFNIELNGTPRLLHGAVFSQFETELRWNWRRCREVARQFDAELMQIGTLPTLRDRDLTLAQMSRLTRYRALNEQILRLRGGRPVCLTIRGVESLDSHHHDVMLEAATTSFQLHLQVAPEQAVRYYNAMQILSAPMVAITANSPLLFGRRLWQESRIPIFEQAVAVGGFDGAAAGPVKRVSFGTGYARESLLEPFQENLEHFPVLLPVDLDQPPEALAHLRLHNGTIWRWNRPLVGFDDDGTPHLRIEHRVIPAGPTLLDSIANAALLYGLSYSLVNRVTPAEDDIGFPQVRDNFYHAARWGVGSTITWLDGDRLPMEELLRTLLVVARDGLQAMGVLSEDIGRYLGVIEGRLASGQTGAAWQLGWLDRHGTDMTRLVAAYHGHQESGLPVHEWPL